LSSELIELAKTLTPDLVILGLPQRLGPGKARNAGLSKCQHEWIFFLDDDAFLPSRYFHTALPLLAKDTIDIFGGPDAPAPEMSSFSTALALSLSSPFCTGSTFLRHKSVGSELVRAKVDQLTSCNLWIRRRFFEESSFPDDYDRTEEVVLLTELENLGARMFYHPKLKVFHHRRETIAEVTRPTFFAGYFRSKLMKQTKIKVHGMVIFWLPSLFVLLHVLVFFDPYTFLELSRFYLALVLAMSLAITAREKKLSLIPMVMFLHWYIVFTYGVGFLAHRLRHPWK